MTDTMCQPRIIRRWGVISTLLVALALLAVLAGSAGAQANAWRSLATPPGYLSAFAASPGTPGVLYANFRDGSGFGGDSNSFVRSDDGGRTWVDLAAGIKKAINGAPTALAVAPNNAKRVYAGSERGVHLSTNGGITWRAWGSGLPGGLGSTTWIAISPANPQIVYIGTAAAGIFRSDNAGASWRSISGGLGADGGGSNIVALAVSSHDANTLYVSTGRESGFYKSTDGGATWTPALANLDVPDGNRHTPYVNAIALAPSNPNIVYIATGAYNAPIARSDNAGASWTAATDVSLTYQNITVIAVDPRDPNRAFAGGGYQRLHTTLNGTTWSVATGGALGSGDETPWILIPSWKTPIVYAGDGPDLYYLGTPSGAASALKVPAPTARVAVRGTGLRLTVTAAVGTAAKGRTAQIQYQRGKRWIAAARVKVPASGRITRTVALTRAKIGGAKVRQLRVRVVLVKSGANPAAVGTVRSARIPAR